jgi:hypothetical protein
MLDCVESVTRDQSLKVPADWKLVPGWQSLVSTAWTREYHRSFGLYRSSARLKPFSFLWGVLKAGVVAPRFLIKQGLAGFPNPNEASFHRIETARQLIKTFKVPWPPTPMDEYLNTG